MRAAVLGSPIAHSRSPVLHRAAYAALGLDWTYDAIEVPAEGLREFIEGLDASWVGLSLTMPLKEAVLPLLDEATATVRLAAAANTVVFRDGRACGFNTDVPGAVRTFTGLGITEATAATVIGGGATARSIAVALAEVGARRITLVVRRPDATGALVELCRELGIHVDVVGFAEAGVTAALDTPLVVSTVPGGAADALSHHLPRMRGALLDVAYSPWPTGFAAAWGAEGAPVASGFELLLWQAVEQVELMTGRPAPIDAMRDALAASRS